MLQMHERVDGIVTGTGFLPLICYQWFTGNLLALYQNQYTNFIHICLIYLLALGYPFSI